MAEAAGASAVQVIAIRKALEQAGIELLIPAKRGIYQRFLFFSDSRRMLHCDQGVHG